MKDRKKDEESDEELLKIAQKLLKFAFNSQDECFLAYSVPYSYSDLLHDLSRWPWESLATTAAGHQVPLLRLGRQTAARRVCLVARAHPGETNASWVMRGVPRRAEIKRFLFFHLNISLNHFL